MHSGKEYNKDFNNKKKQDNLNIKSNSIYYIQIDTKIYKFYERFIKSS